MEIRCVDGKTLYDILSQKPIRPNRYLLRKIAKKKYEFFIVHERTINGIHGSVGYEVTRYPVVKYRGKLYLVTVNQFNDIVLYEVKAHEL